MKNYLQLLIVVLATTMLLATALASPSGATSVTQANSSRLAASGAGSNAAIAGNVTELTIYGDSITQAWQGYYGNVSGAIRLADSDGNNMYNWSLASPKGQVYATPTNSVTWANLACFNMSNTTLVSDVETAYGIDATSIEGVNETFNLNDHTGFYANGIQFTTGLCKNVQTYNNAGVKTFEEVLLSDGANPIFASLLKEDVTGFDSKSHDFQMLVLEDGHNNVLTKTYYFWVELQ